MEVPQLHNTVGVLSWGSAEPQKVPVFMEPEVNYRVHKAPPLGLTQSENQIRNFTRSFNETILIV